MPKGVYVRKKKQCAVEGCIEPYKCCGYCSRHYQQFKDHGRDIAAVEGKLNTAVEKATKRNQWGFVPNTWEPTVYGNLCYILLTHGYVAVCDASDYHTVSTNKNKWCYRKGYAYQYQFINGQSTPIALHQILNPHWNITDHRNGNPLDCRRSNMRECTPQTNTYNKAKRKGPLSSKYIGVHYDSRRGHWRGRITCQGKSTYLGSFSTESAAGRAYDAKAVELFGEFARLNFPEEKPSLK